MEPLSIPAFGRSRDHDVYAIKRHVMFGSEVVFVWPYLLSALVCIILILLAWHQRKKTVSWPFMLLMILAAGWSLMASMPFLFGSVVDELVWANAKIVFVAILPVAWVLLAATYSRKGKKLSVVLASGLLIIPFVTIVLLAMNPAFGFQFGLADGLLSSSDPDGEVAFGVWYWVQTIYSYVLIALGVGYYIRTAFASSKNYRKHSLMVAAGAILPLVANGIFHSQFSQFTNLDLTPIGFALSGVLFAWGLFRYRMLDMIPFARAAIITTMDDVLIVLDAEGLMIDINPAGEALLKIVGVEITGKHISDFSSELAIEWNSARGGLEPEHPELFLGYDNAGQEGAEGAWFDVNIKPMPRHPNHKLDWLLVLRDITAHKQSQLELIRAKEVAEEHSRLKMEFIENMSHEIRTPLSGIIGLAQVLAEEVNEQHQEFVALIEKGGKRLLRTLDSIMEVSRLSTERLVLRNEAVDISELVHKLVSKFEPEAKEKGLSISVDSEELRVGAVLDVGMFRKSLQHLLDNAVEYTDNGTISVRIDATDDSFTVRIKDTGRGMSPEFLPYIFDVFRQESTGTSRSFEGAGLGLTVAKGLIQQMGGTLEIDTEPEKGTLVTVGMPKAQITQKATGRQPVAHQRPIKIAPQEKHSDGLSES